MLSAAQLEEWLPAVGFDGLYEVSNLGRIRGLDKRVRCGWGKTRVMRGKVLHLTTNTCGYLRVALGSHRKFKTIVVHRIVAKAFINNPLSKGYVNHKDGCKTNNNVSNLEWATKHEDCQHAQDTGLNKARFKSRKITLSQAHNILKIRKQTGYGGNRIAKITSIPKSIVDGILYRGNYAESATTARA